MTKQLYVASQVQAILLKEILINEIINGYWSTHRPANHGDYWVDVEVSVSSDGNLGGVNFTSPRAYNFTNPEFLLPNTDALIQCAQKVKPSTTFKSLKSELIELSQIVGGRLSNKNLPPVKLFRGIRNSKKTEVKKPDLSANLKRKEVFKTEKIEIPHSSFPFNSWIVNLD